VFGVSPPFGSVAICELISDPNRSLDVLGVTETWHRGDDDVSLRTAAPSGYSVVAAARQTGVGGGVAVYYRSHYRCVNVSTPPTTTFESVCLQLTSSGCSFVLLTVYRPGSVRPTSAFFDELSSLLEVLVLQRGWRRPKRPCSQRCRR